MREKKTTHFLYYLTAFFSGLGVMAIELTVSRLLAPYFGNSMFVWTNVIGIVMLALALGYYLGGLLADQKKDKTLYFHIVLFAGLWSLCIPFVAQALFTNLVSWIDDLSSLVVWGSFISVFVLLVFPMVFLGMVVPFTVKLVTPNMQKLGHASGQVSMVSTAGSLFGTFLPAFVLVPLIGSAKIFVLMGMILVLLAGIGLKKWKVFVFVLIGFFLFFVTPPLVSSAVLIHEEETAYGTLFVTELGTERRLHMDQLMGSQSVYDTDTPLVDAYYSYFGVLPSYLDDPESILILGHASGSFTRVFNTYYPELSIKGVELNPKVTELSREWMGLDELEVDIVHSDARAYLEWSDESYDLILIDTYQSAFIPPHLATLEFFELVEAHLNPDGVMAVNAAASEGEFLDRFMASAMGPFELGYSIPIPGSYNHMLVYGSDLESSDGLPSDLLSHREHVVWNKKKIEMAEPFLDDQSSEVEILSEEMILDLLKHY